MGHLATRGPSTSIFFSLFPFLFFFANTPVGSFEFFRAFFLLWWLQKFGCLGIFSWQGYRSLCASRIG